MGPPYMAYINGLVIRSPRITESWDGNLESVFKRFEKCKHFNDFRNKLKDLETKVFSFEDVVLKR